MPVDFADRTDFENAERGLIDALDPCVVNTGNLIRLALSNGALIQTENPTTKADPDLTLTRTKLQLLGMLAGHGLDGIEHTGNPAAIGKLLSLLETPDPAFPIITP